MLKVSTIIAQGNAESAKGAESPHRGVPGRARARLIKGAGKDIQGVLLLHKLHGKPIKEPP